uniref:Reverse transcriptase domain-containing protein n=1 Tax=Chenopodium quinoa TaxID=63459 RepID=A0A803N7N4_CHEQI
MLIDASSRHEFVSTLDGFVGYNQKRIAEDDRSKTAFRCPGSLRLYEYVYIDYVLVKSYDLSKHLEHFILAFEMMRKLNMKMNPLKCAFGVKASNFLGFFVHKNGIEVDQNKAKAVLEASPPTNKKELHKFLGKINYV